jgi:hypothetical protein
MFLGTALIIGGLWWARDVRRRPGHSRRDLRGPLIMTGVGVVWLGTYLLLVSRW